MKIDVTRNDPVEVTTEAGNTYRLYRHGELYPRSPKPDDIKNRVYFRSQELKNGVFSTVEDYASYNHVKPKDDSKIIKLWYSKEKGYDYIVDCVFLEDCVPFTEEEKRERLIPREEYKTAYQWKIEDDREVKAGVKPVVKEFWSEKDYENIRAEYYHISDTEPIVYRTKNQWRELERGIKAGADFIERDLIIDGVEIPVKFYHEQDTYSLNDQEACDEYGGDLRTERQWEQAGRLIKNKKLYEKKTFNIHGTEKTYKYYHRDNTYLI